MILIYRYSNLNSFKTNEENKKHLKSNVFKKQHKLRKNIQHVVFFSIN